MREMPEPEDLPTDLFELIDVIMADLDQLDEDIDAFIAADDATDADDQRAQAARDGELGADWKTVQRRIDSGETTLMAVFSGADESDAATRLRQLSEHNLSLLREELLAEEDEEDTEDLPAAQLHETFAESQRLHRRFAEEIAHIINPGGDAGGPGTENRR